MNANTNSTPNLLQLFSFLLFSVISSNSLADECNIQKIEAESAVLGGKFTIFKDEQTSGKSFVSTPKESSWSLFDSNDNHFAKFTIELKEDGEYAFDGMVFSEDNHSDSFTVQLNDGDKFTWDIDSNKAWYIDRIGDKGSVDPMSFILSKGKHTLILYRREVQTKIDYFNIVKLDCQTKNML